MPNTLIMYQVLNSQKNINGPSGWYQQATPTVNKALKFMTTTAQKPAAALNNFLVSKNKYQLVPANNRTVGKRNPKLFKPNKRILKPPSQKNKGGWSK